MADNKQDKKTTANRWGDPVFEIVKPAPETPAELADEKLKSAAGGSIVVDDYNYVDIEIDLGETRQNASAPVRNWVYREYEVTLDDPPAEPKQDDK